MEVIVDSRLKFNYASWYLLGLERVFGKSAITYDAKPFIGLSYGNNRDYNAGMALILHESDKQWKVFIDFEDVSIVFKDRYEWCDVYGMVNPTKEQMSEYEKMVAIGPEFGITLNNKLLTVELCLRNYLKSRYHTSISMKECLRDYLYSNIRRRRIEAYKPADDVRSNYIFHASTLWYNNFAKTDTNYWRGEFLRACQKAGIEIEGGLFYIGESEAVLSEMPDYPKYKETYKDFIYNRRLSMDDYIQKTKKSVMVFNTPSVCGCHGWKLAEYLCMGKAVISTPLSRELPAPLVHGENIHFVKTKEELYDAVVKINTNSAYRKKLEAGARKYYKEWIAPEVAIRRLLPNH